MPAILSRACSFLLDPLAKDGLVLLRYTGMVVAGVVLVARFDKTSRPFVQGGPAAAAFMGLERGCDKTTLRISEEKAQQQNKDRWPANPRSVLHPQL